MDEMQYYEINDIFDNLSFLDKNTWEQTRNISYIIAQVNSKKKLDSHDIMKLPWDDNGDIEKDEEKITSISNEEILELKELAKQWGGK